MRRRPTGEEVAARKLRHKIEVAARKARQLELGLPIVHGKSQGRARNFCCKAILGFYEKL